MTLRLKIEVLKVFSLELDFSSGKKEKEEKNVRQEADTGKLSTSK